MSELALHLIAENIEKHRRGEDATYLDLGNCGLTELPPEIGELVWLEELVLSNEWEEYDFISGKWEEKISQNRGEPNWIQTLKQIKNLTEIKKLVLSKNRSDKDDFRELLDLTPLIHLFQLEELYCYKTYISDLNPLSNLTQLQIFYCNSSQIADLNPLSNLTQLQIFYCNSTKVANLDPLSNLTQLQQLYCSYTQVADLTPLANLTQLQQLYCSYTQVADLTPLNNLTQLKILSCYDTRVTDLTPLTNLIQLQQLYCSYTQVADLTPLTNFVQLQQLYCSYTQVADLTPLTNFVQLQQLYCSYTQVADLTPLNNLTQLEIISCSNSPIVTLPFLKHFNQLQLLDCRNSYVIDLTPTIPLIEKGVPVNWGNYGNGILVEGCPLSTPPPEVVRQGNTAILRYFEEREKAGGTDEIYEAKLLLIGEGGAGKTSLCRKLFDSKAGLPLEKDSTRGIDIQPLYFDLSNGKRFRLNVWDFAGQGKYQSANSFFYTHRSLYIFVDDTRTLNENEAYRTFYNFWLETAELFGNNSPLLILHNQKADRTRPGFNLGSFQERFPFIKELFCINLANEDAQGIEDIKRQIERWAQKLTHIGDKVPKTWVAVREEIEKERQLYPYISEEHYQELCAQHGITDELMQSDLSRYFHDLGVFLHFQDHSLLRRDVFLQNEWVTNAVYKILDDALIAEQKRGRFDKGDLERLWNEGLYARRREELLALMLQFELCYQVQDTQTYITPQLLLGDIPSYDLGNDIPLQLRYEYGFMPKGLFYRLIVRLHRHIAQGQSAVWNSGAVLARAGAQADIIESLDRRSISIRATGERTKELVTIINEEVEKLHDTYGERLRVEVKIPCNCSSCKTSTTPYFFSKKALESRLANGKRTVECDMDPYEDVDVQGLLDGVFDKSVHRKGRLKRIFISYSHIDEVLMNKLEIHLAALKRSQLIETWNKGRITAGSEWNSVIKTAIEVADIILLLVSPDFLASEQIWSVEIQHAMQRHNEATAHVIPIHLRPCDIKGMPFYHLQGLPRGTKPITSFDDEDEAFMQVVQGIRDIIIA